MLFCTQINNYEDFKSRFGYKTNLSGDYLVNSNGGKQRKNNIAYLFWKEETIYYRKQGYSLEDAFNAASKYNTSKEVFEHMLFKVCGSRPSDSCPVHDFSDYLILNYGICIDGDISSIRYQKRGTNKVYKMKIGKFINKYLDSLTLSRNTFWLSNPTLRIFFIEEFTELWKNKRLKEQSMKVVVNKDFESIYQTKRRPADSMHFNSCMDDDPNWHYYAQNPNIYDAVSLQDSDGYIYARAILVHCLDNNNIEHSYLERIYSNKRMYKDLLFEKAKTLNIFDLYKSLEASCHDNLEIYKVSNKQKITDTLHIDITLKDGNYMSYQDTFKWYYPKVKKMFNSPQDNLGESVGLATTNVHIYVP